MKVGNRRSNVGGGSPRRFTHRASTRRQWLAWS
jgi:hypothetical protein